MANPPLNRVVKHLRTLMAPATSQPLRDSDLLRRYTDHHDEAAFAGLVQRHGPTVLGVGRSVLGQTADAEDVFQATFLLLARKAAAIRRQESVAGWLYKVAYRLALRCKASAAHRRRHEALAPAQATTPSPDELTWRELQDVLYEELDRLPEKYRGPLVLHYLQGRTQEEAARQLGWAKGTLKGRLERARDLLRTRLARRGLAPGAALLAAALSPKVSVALPASLVHAVVQAARPSAAGAGSVPGPVARLIEGGLPMLTGTRLKTVTALLLTGGLIATAAGLWAGPRPDPGQEPRTIAKADAPAKGATKPDKPAGPRDQGGRKVTVTGRVLGADGKPVARAQVALVVRPKRPTLNDQDNVLGRAGADADGEFRLEVPLAADADFWEVTLLAGAKGQGLGVERLSPDVRQKDTLLKLPPEQVLRGRLVDVQGQPAAGVKVYLGHVGGTVKGTPVGVHLSQPPEGFSLWPGPVTTDAQGRFAFPGVNQDIGVGLQVRDDRFAPQHIYRSKNDGAGDFKTSLAPAKWLEGRVLTEDTGRPVPHARLTVGGADSQRQVAYVGINGRGQADAQGRFRINLPPGKWFNVTASAPVGQPYLTPRKTFEWPRGAVRHTLDLKLPRGVLVRGKVTEAVPGKPVAGAGVQYYPRRSDNPNLRTDVLTSWQDMAVSGPDGVFQMAVLPGPGHLLLSGPTQDFIHLEIGSNLIDSGRPGGMRYYPDGLVKLDLPARSPTREVTVTLRRAVTVRGRLLDPDGKPVAKALMFHRLHVAGFDLIWRFPVPVSDGNFEVHGCDPEKTYPVYFLDPQNQWGAAVQVSGKDAGPKPLTVRLAPCGRATVRFLDPQGKPVKDFWASPAMVLTPGADRHAGTAARTGELLADEELLANLDRHNYWHGPRSDAQGRCTLPALIPGATYQFNFLQKGDRWVRKEFTVKAGQTRDLGDITLDPSR
jgi:RNA polymerase sigma factor (sigma-70 family)